MEIQKGITLLPLSFGQKLAVGVLENTGIYLASLGIEGRACNGHSARPRPFS